MSPRDGPASPDPAPGDLLTPEQLRLAALQRFGILDTPPEPQFDHLVELAARVFEMPMSTLTFVDEDRQWFKASHGPLEPEGPRSQSFCSVAIAQDGVMVVPDATQHAQLRSYPNVLGEPHIRSYAGAPLVTPDGHKLGTLCVMGTEPREFTAKEQELLASFADMAMAELKLRQALQDLSKMAMSDTLTGLPNRVQFRQQLTEACRRADLSGGKVVVGLLDLDRFKLINDTFGHAAGDGLLKAVAHRLNEATAPGDLVARMSGDEFVMLFTGIQTGDDIDRRTRRLEDRFAVPFLIEGREVFVHWSLGLSVYPDDTQELDTLLSSADAAMYRVKRAGGGHRTFRQEDGRNTSQVECLSALHRAIEHDELRLYFQPKVNAQSRVVVAHEALLRWVRPSGIVGPLDFIPLAESSGLILPIGRWVLQEAVNVLSTGRLPEVCVNVSALELRQADYVDHLRALLEERRVAPQRLWLELTESSLLEPRFVPVLQELKGLGVRTAMDDFGKGYSSLMSLVSLPIQMVKIDQSFTAGIGEETPEQRRALEVVRGIVALVTAYGLHTVAEGVETLEQAELLTRVGCTELQGYLFGRPEPLP